MDDLMTPSPKGARISEDEMSAVKVNSLPDPGDLMAEMERFDCGDGERLTSSILSRSLEMTPEWRAIPKCAIENAIM